MVMGTTILNTLANLPSDVVPVYSSSNFSSATTTPYSPMFAAAEANGIVGYMMDNEYYSATTLAISIMGAITLLAGIIQAFLTLRSMFTLIQVSEDNFEY